MLCFKHPAISACHRHSMMDGQKWFKWVVTKAKTSLRVQVRNPACLVCLNFDHKHAGVAGSAISSCSFRQAAHGGSVLLSSRSKERWMPLKLMQWKFYSFQHLIWVQTWKKQKLKIDWVVVGYANFYKARRNERRRLREVKLILVVLGCLLLIEIIRNHLEHREIEI